MASDEVHAELMFRCTWGASHPDARTALLLATPAARQPRPEAQVRETRPRMRLNSLGAPRSAATQRAGS